MFVILFESRLSCEKEHGTAHPRLQAFRLEDSRIILSKTFPSVEAQVLTAQG